MKIIAYNVEFAKATTPEAVALHLESENPDMVCFSEVPKGDWTALVGRQLGMKHNYVGQVASANHETKYVDKTGIYYGKFKSILSRTPLEESHEKLLSGIGWSPVSVVFARSVVDGKELLVGSLHIPSGVKDPSNSCAADLADLMSTYEDRRIVIGGDYNDLPDSAPLQLLYEQGFQNSGSITDADCKGKKTCDAKSEKNLGIIDHFLYLGDLKAVESKIMETEAPQSDHFAITATFLDVPSV